ncbi:MAG: amine dehydrogenase large subunit [Paracoccus sp. (in: a-proteobacteria)]
MKQYLIATISTLVASGSLAMAQETDIQPETLIVEERISEGEHVFIMDMGIATPSQISVLNADDLSMEGNIGAGNFSQMMISPDHSSIYTASVYMSRYNYGDIEAVLHEWDAATLTAKREFVINDKLAQTLTQKGTLNLSADGAFMIVQNATPATSVSVINMADGTEVAEIPTPGCWTAYPAVEGSAFTMLCGDGTVAKYSYTAEGSAGDPGKSEKIFDADADPLFGNAHRVDGNLVYISYSGSLYVVDDSGDVPVLTKTIDFAEDGWAPSGYGLMGYHEPSKTMFVTMHQNPSDGSHKMPAAEIWAINMDSGQVVGRGEASGESNITVSGGENPVIFGTDHVGGVHRYDVVLGDEVTITKATSRDGVALFPTLLVTDY